MVSKEQVSQLEVAMDNLLGVDVLDGLHQLVDVVAGFDLVKLLAALNQVCQGLIRADVQHDVDILLVLEVAIEADDVLVVERPVNLDLTSQLLAGLSSRQIGFGDDLQGPRHIFVLLSLDWLDPADLVALGEAALAEEAASLIGDDLAWLVVVFRSKRLYFLLNDLDHIANI